MNSYKRCTSKSILKINKQHNLTDVKSKSARRSIKKCNETKEKVLIRRFHDAQRMARCRARKRRALEEAKMLETINFTKQPVIAELKRKHIMFGTVNSIISISCTKQFQTYMPKQNSQIITCPPHKQNKYSELLGIIEELRKNIKLMYAGNRTSAERLKVGIIKARTLIKECLSQIQINLQQ